jgi:hypothetical protein
MKIFACNQLIVNWKRMEIWNFYFSQMKYGKYWFQLQFLAHIFKKMGSTEIVVSSVRLSVCPSVCPSVSLSVCQSVRLSVCLLFLSRYST